MKKVTINAIILYFLLTITNIFALGKDFNLSEKEEITSAIATTPITNANIQTAVNLWISDEALATTTYGHISSWDVSNVTDMSELFKSKSTFNDDISAWDVSNVTNMTDMFRAATSFNQNINAWKVSNVQNMTSMFGSATGFNKNIDSWDVSNVTNMSFMFSGATAFNQDLGAWDVTKVTNMDFMFGNASQFNQNLTAWCVTNISSEPTGFSFNSGLQSGNFPVWGTCPAKTAITQANIKSAANAWRNDEALAGRTYGHIRNWDVSNVTDMSTLFRYRPNFNSNISEWDVSNVTNMSEMFREARDFNQDISSWDVSNVTDMSIMFYSANDFNQDIGSWNVSNVEDMEVMFSAATKFNQDIGSWDVSKVTDMNAMFFGARSFNQNISSWDVSNVTDMRVMFTDTDNFNQDISSWNVSNVTNMNSMFSDAIAFNQDISAWDVSKVTNMITMFKDAVAFNQDLSAWCVTNISSLPSSFATGSALQSSNFPVWGSCPAKTAITQANIQTAVDAWVADALTAGKTYGHIRNWDVSAVTDMSNLFNFKTTFNDNIDLWDVSNVTNMSFMFRVASAFNQDIGSWDVSNVTDMSSMFDSADAFNQDISAWNVSEVTTMSRMFIGTDNFNQDISSWNIAKLTDMSSMFENADAFNADISGLDVSNVTNMTKLFRSTDLFNQDISSWNVSNVTSMEGMFSNSKAFNKSLNSWNVSKVTNMEDVFSGSEAFDGDIGAWDVSNVITMQGMFENTDAFNKDINDWNVSKVTTMEGMFDGALLFNKNINSWDVTSVTTMRSMFNEAAVFNQDIGSWDTSNVEDVAYMFFRAPLFNQNIAAWDVSKVTSMRNMFDEATAFNQDLSTWCVTNFVTEPIDFSTDSALIANNLPVWGTCPTKTAITQANIQTAVNLWISNPTDASKTYGHIRNWDVSAVTDMSNLFYNKTTFNDIISDWNVANVTNMLNMFYNATAFNQDISSWNVTGVPNMTNMFRNATAFNQDISSWNVANVDVMNFMFRDATSFNQNLSSWNVSGVTKMAGMFRGTTAFNQDISSWDVSNVDNMNSMFRETTAFDQNLGAWNIASITDFNDMFLSSGISKESISNTLYGWSQLSSIPSALDLGDIASDYNCLGKIAIDILTGSPNNWQINTTGASSCGEWTGTTDTDWNNASNWNGSIPTSSDDVLLTNKTNMPTISSNVTVNSLVIDENASLTVTGNLSTNNGITLKSGATLIPNSTINNVTYEMNIPTTNWYIISAPFSGQQLGTFLSKHDFATGSGSNLGMGFYNNDGTGWNYYTTADFTNTNTINTGDGYAIKLKNAGNLTFTGDLSGSAISKNIATGTANNFNLVGNPHTAYVNSTAFLSDNSANLTEQTIWVWNGNRYETYNNLNALEISPLQGFFVDASSNSNVNFSTANRTHQSSGTFMRTEQHSKIELTLSTKEANTRTTIFYVDGKTKGFDNGYDSKLFDASTSALEIYTNLLADDDGRKLSIQSLPNKDFENTIIPLGVKADANKEITISANFVNLPPELDVYVEDRQENQFINLNENDYVFTTSSALNGIGRFYLNTKSNVLSTDTIDLQTVSIYTVDNSTLRIQGLNAGTSTIKLYNVLGKEILNKTFISTNKNDIDLPQLSTGVYIVDIKSEKGSINKKIVIK